MEDTDYAARAALKKSIEESCLNIIRMIDDNSMKFIDLVHVYNLMEQVTDCFLPFK